MSDEVVLKGIFGQDVSNVEMGYAKMAIAEQKLRDRVSAIVNRRIDADASRFKGLSAAEFERREIEEANEIISKVNVFDFLEIDCIKHPNRNEWAVPFENHVLDLIPSGTNKDFLLATATLSVIEGRRKTKQDMINGGWV